MAELIFQAVSQENHPSTENCFDVQQFLRSVDLRKAIWCHYARTQQPVHTALKRDCLGMDDHEYAVIIMLRIILKKTDDYEHAYDLREKNECFYANA